VIEDKRYESLRISEISGNDGRSSGVACQQARINRARPGGQLIGITGRSPFTTAVIYSGQKHYSGQIDTPVTRIRPGRKLHEARTNWNGFMPWSPYGLLRDHVE